MCVCVLCEHVCVWVIDVHMWSDLFIVFVAVFGVGAPNRDRSVDIESIRVKARESRSRLLAISE